MLGANVIFIEQSHASAEFIANAHGAKMEVGAYTVNDRQRLHDLIQAGLDFPCTDYPEMAIAELANTADNTAAAS